MKYWKRYSTKKLLSKVRVTYIRKNNPLSQKATKRNQKTSLIMMKVSIQQEYIITINLYGRGSGQPKNTRQILLAISGEIDSNIKIAMDYSTLLQSMEKSSEQKIKGEILELNLSKLNGQD